MMLEPNRKGEVTEYKKGHIYLTHVEWEDGHCEIEIHRCVPQQLFHSCDSGQLEMAQQALLEHAAQERKPALIVVGRS